MGKKKKATETALPKKLYVCQHQVDLYLAGDDLADPAYFAFKSPNRIRGGTQHVGEYVLVEEGTTQTFLMPDRS